jgi:DNA topoisomerase-1
LSENTTLVIVESPAKAKTIERYLGKDYRVLSSVGHIREIPPKDEDAIDVAQGFKTRYELIPGKKKTITELKRAVKSASDVLLATDEDREGEAIAWHLCEVLGLDAATTKRIVFHEITQSALEAAVAAPRFVDMDLVHAQQARQILDRLVGYELSPVVWKKVPGGKSAGRVQSPALRLVVEREREIQAFESEQTYKVSALLAHSGGDELKADLAKPLDSQDAAQAFLQKLIGASWQVSDVSSKPATRNPAPPFTTSTLQQDANSKLGFSPRSTMSAAQALYQNGKITYMRTDSTNLSTQALGSIHSWIEQHLGKEYAQTRQYKTKAAGAQEAHEAIRPTDISLEEAGSNDFERRLYRLIRARTLASQMAPATLEKTVATIVASTAPAADERFEAKGEAVLFDGFLRVYGKSSEKYLPKLAAGDSLDALQVTARQSFSNPPARYTEGSLVKKLEELGIGRPSTYATILDTIKSRGYVNVGTGEGSPRSVILLTLKNDRVETTTDTEKSGADKGKLLPSAIGEILSDFLLEYFTQIVDYNFTARTESELDSVESGSLDEVAMLSAFYGPFHALIEQGANIDRKAVSKSREVGIDPASGKIITARVGRFGPMLQLGEASDDEKPVFANLPEGSTIDNVTLEAALEMFKLPRKLGTTADGKEVLTNVGRFGPYVQVGKGKKGAANAAVFVSFKKDGALDPFNVTLEQALELYQEKLEKDAAKTIADFGNGIQVLNGRYGPYITDGKKNVTIKKIDKDLDPASITAEQALTYLAQAPEKSARGRSAKKKASKKQ